MNRYLGVVCGLVLGVFLNAPAAPVVLYETGWEAAPASPAWVTGAISPQNGWDWVGDDPLALRVVAEGSADASVFGQAYVTPYGSRFQRLTASTSTTITGGDWAWPDLTAAWLARPAGHDVLVASIDVLVPAGGSADNSYYGLQGYSPGGSTLYFGLDVTPAGRFVSLSGADGIRITEQGGMFAYDTWFNLAIRVNFQTGFMEVLTNGVPVPGLIGTNAQVVGAVLADVDLFCVNDFASPNPRVVFTDNYRVTVDAVQTPPVNNDAFANRLVLSGDRVTVGGNNAEATDEPFEPEHSAIPTSLPGTRRTLWYSWTPLSDTAVRVTLSRTNGAFPNPMLAVWTGPTLSTLSSVASNFSGVAVCRVVFRAAGGTAYHIAVDDSGSLGDGGTHFQLEVESLPSPANDAFAGRTGLVDWPVDTVASFLGASREPGEPAHGSGGYPETLWWTWTAPAGVFTNRVTLHADAVSLPPDVGIYTGAGFPLAAAPGVANSSFGMTRVVSFLATPGATYQIAVAGRQSDPAPNAASAQFGNVRLRFNASTLALLITNRTGLTNFNFASPFFETTLLTNGLRIENWGNAISRPVRVRLEASPGYSVLADRAAPAFPAVSNLFTSAAVNVGPAQPVSLLVTGRCPAPIAPDFGEGVGWGVYALLEEQVGTAWFVVDHQLAGFGLWPGVGGFNGPGGGVVRIDPQAGGGTLCVPRLSDFQIQAPAGLREGGSINLSATAFFNCPSNFTFTTTIWSNSHPTTLVTTNGVLRAGAVTNDTLTTVTCFFEYRGVISNATRQLVISNLPPPRIATGTRLPNGRFQLGGTGVPDRRHSVQASTNLCCPGNWINLMPGNLVATNGMWSFLDTNAPNHPRRFYRVQELD